MDSPPLLWDAFAAAVAEIAAVPPGSVTANARLLDDLGLDSLALTEVIVFCVVELEMETLARDLGERPWDRITIGDLYDEYKTGESKVYSPDALLRLDS